MNRASCPIKTESLFPVFIQPLSSETTVSEVSPLYCSATQGRSVNAFMTNVLNSTNDPMTTFSPSFLRNWTVVLSVPYPIVYIKTPVMLRGTAGEKCKIYLSTPNGECPLIPSPIPCGIVGHSHTPPLCFATQNIGEVVRSAGGVGKYRQR